MQEGMASAAGKTFSCVLTGDPCFSTLHAHELVEDGLAYRVRGSMDDGLSALAQDFSTETSSLALLADGTLPAHTIDVVRWAGLRHVRLDKAGFIKHWQRYLVALQAHVQSKEADGEAQADALLLQAHGFARKLMHNFDELDVLTGASDDVRGPLAVLHYLDDDPLTPCLFFLAAAVIAPVARAVSLSCL